MTSCTWCKIGLTAGFAALAGITGGFAGALIGAATAGAIVGALLGAGIGISEIGDLICCYAGAKACCAKGTTQFWRTYGMMLKASAQGTLTAADCRSLKQLIDTMLANEQIDAEQAERLRAALAKDCG